MDVKIPEIFMVNRIDDCKIIAWGADASEVPFKNKNTDQRE